VNYLSVCSGIEAATVAWHPLGWRPIAFSETDRFPSAVLAHHYPDVPNLGDINGWQKWALGQFDLLVGGTPCQSFSVAGLRRGLDDPRGNLMLVYLAILAAHRPRWMVWENVSGVLSIHGGRPFGTLLGALEELGYGWAYRILDAQYVGVPQRRRRVFVVGYLGNWRYPAAVLFERHSLSGNPPPRREAGAEVAGTIAPGAHPGGFNGQDAERCNLVTQALTGRLGGGGPDDNKAQGGFYVAQCHGSNVGEMGELRRGNGGVTGGVPFLAHALTAQKTASHRMDPSGETLIAAPLTGDAYADRAAEESNLILGTPLVSLTCGDRGLSPDQVAGGMALATRFGVRRLTPRECERLQGFADDYTLIPYRGKPAKDGPRYRAIGNSMARPVMAWIGKRIDELEGPR